jgi:hypothetical protein
MWELRPRLGGGGGKKEKIRKQDDCDISGSTGTLAVSRSGRASLRREQCDRFAQHIAGKLLAGPWTAWLAVTWYPSRMT